MPTCTPFCCAMGCNRNRPDPNNTTVCGRGGRGLGRGSVYLCSQAPSLLARRGGGMDVGASQCSDAPVHADHWTENWKKAVFK